MGESEKNRIRFVNWTGGLNTKDEPYLLAENEYALGENITLEGGVPCSRDGAAKFDATNGAIAAAFRGLGEYLYYDTSGNLTRYLLAVSNANPQALYIWKNTGSGYSYVGTASTFGLTQGTWPSITNFYNKALITNGTDKPRELNAYYSENSTYELGIEAPTRTLVICDFHSTAASDTGYTHAKDFSYSHGSGASIASVQVGVTKWELLNDGLKSNDYCLKMTTNTNGGTVESTISYGSGLELDLTNFHDGFDSDNSDWLMFNLTTYDWDLLNYIELYIDFDNGLFNTKYIKHRITKYGLDIEDWGGFNGGTYRIWRSKRHLEKDRNTDTYWTPDWSHVRAIKFKICRETYSSTSNDRYLTVYIDYLRMFESPPVALPTVKRIAGFEATSDEIWYKTLSPVNTSADYETTIKTEGLTSIKIINSAASGFIRSGHFSKYDLAHWDDGYPVKPTDCLVFDVRTTTDVACLFTIRVHSGTRRIGYSGHTQDHSVGTALMPGLLAAGTWQRVFIPFGWIKNWKNSVSKVYSYYHSTSGRTHPTFSDVDDSLSGWTPDDVLNSVDSIVIAAVASASTTMYIDNLRIESFPMIKPLSLFVGSGPWDIDIPLNGFWNVVDAALSGIPVVNFAWNAMEGYFRENFQKYHTEVVFGEQWSVTGGEWEFDAQVRTFITSLRVEVGKGGSAMALLTFSPAKDLTEYGRDSSDALLQGTFTDGTKKYSGMPSDDSDMITLDVCCNKIDNLDRIIVIFGCGSGDGDYYQYIIEGSKLDKRKKGETIRTSGMPELVPEAIRDVGDSLGLNLSTKQGGRKFIGDMNWTKIKMKKRDFVRYGTSGTASWENVASVKLIIMASDAGDVTVWFDKLLLQSAGSLEGEYRYKVVFRSEDGTSAPSESSPPVLCAGADVRLESIPVTTDARVKYKDIYRIGGGGSSYQYVNTIDVNQTTFYDEVANEDLGNALDPDFQRPPICNYGWTHGNRYWLANNKLYRSRIFYSRPFLPAAFPETNYIDIEPSAYGDVTGACPRDDDLIVFKRNAVYRVVEGANPNDKNVSLFWWRAIDKTIGCDCPRSICSRNNVIYWIWRNKPYRLVGNTVDDIFGEKVKNLFAYVDSDASGCYYNGRILFAYKSGSGSTVNDKIISFNVRENCWEGVHNGTGWAVNDMMENYDGTLVAAGNTAISGSYHLLKLFSGNYDTEAATHIAAKVGTRYVTGFEKRLEGLNLWAWACKSGSGDSLVIDPILDYVSTSNTDTFSLASQSQPQVNRISIRGQDVAAFLGFNISCSTDSGTWKLLMAILEAIADTDQ